MAKAVAKKTKIKRNVPTGVAHIHATFNNTIITISDVNGDVVSWATSGGKGFKGSRKSTPFAAQVAAEDAAKRAMDSGMRSVAVLVKGPGAGRESGSTAASVDPPSRSRIPGGRRTNGTNQAWSSKIRRQSTRRASTASAASTSANPSSRANARYSSSQASWSLAPNGAL